MIASLPKAWQAVTWREGGKGPMRKEFAALRMHWGKGCQARSLDDSRTATSAEGWLVGERPLAKEGATDGETLYYFSNLPTETSLQDLATAVRARWSTQGNSTRTVSSFVASSTMADRTRSAGRRWDGFHRHVAVAGALAYSFLLGEMGPTWKCLLDQLEERGLCGA